MVEGKLMKMMQAVRRNGMDMTSVTEEDFVTINVCGELII